MFCIVESQKLWEKLHDIWLLINPFCSSLWILLSPPSGARTVADLCGSVAFNFILFQLFTGFVWWVRDSVVATTDVLLATQCCCLCVQIWVTNLVTTTWCLVLHLLPRVLVDNGGSCHTTLLLVAWCLRCRCFSCAVLWVYWRSSTCPTIFNLNLIKCNL